MQLIGYGNPGRCDDGLGPVFAARIEARGLPGLDVFTDYQLTVDHALQIASAPTVVFVDALMNSAAPFDFAALEPAASHDLGSHSLSPASVLALAGTLFDARPKAFVLGISGVEFGEVREGLSGTAEENLRQAEDFFVQWFESPEQLKGAKGLADA